MFHCPVCSSKLQKLTSKRGIAYGCPECGGASVSLYSLKQHYPPPGLVSHLWSEATHDPAPSRKFCPHCGRRMALVNAPVGNSEVTLDVCTSCRTVWFDRTELRHISAAASPPEPALSQKAREAVALNEVNRIRELAAEPQDDAPAPDAVWKYIPGLLGMPVEMENRPLSRLPVGVWSVTLLAVFVYFVTSAGLEHSIRAFGFVPDQWTRYGGATIITAFFLHAGWFHLLSNMYFLVVFGDNVEDRIGTMWFLVLLAVSHLVGIALHGALDPHSDMPLVGASGGIAGLIAYYAVTFPRTRLAILVFFLYWVRIPAIGMLFLYVFIQLAGAQSQVWGLSNISYLGHLGGLTVGITAGLISRILGHEVRR
jgi:membrane associated rhomboid family serine protease/Zn-finger nucleic acid-binding protein